MRENAYAKEINLTAARLAALRLPALANAVAAGATIQLQRGSVVAIVRCDEPQLPADAMLELNSPQFANACRAQTAIDWNTLSGDLRFLASISHEHRAVLLRDTAAASGSAAVHVGVALLPNETVESLGRRFVSTTTRCLQSLLGGATSSVRMSFHSPVSPFILEAAATSPKTQAAIKVAMQSVPDGMFDECCEVSIDECDQRARLEDMYHGELDTVTAFRARRPLVLLRGPTAAAVAAVHEVIVSSLLERYPFDDPLPVEKLSHVYSLGFRDTSLRGATELRLISVSAGNIDANTVALLRLAAQNCKELQCVELAFSTGLAEEDVLLFLAAPSVRYVSIEGLPFAENLRAGVYASKCVEPFGDGAASQCFHAFVRDATAFLDDAAPLDEYVVSGDAVDGVFTNPQQQQ